jgi:hypothetical protein
MMGTQTQRPPLLLVTLKDGHGRSHQATLPARMIGPWILSMAEDGHLTVVIGGYPIEITVTL